MVQWLKLCSPNAGGLGSIPGQGTRSHMPKMGARKLQLKKILGATRWIKDVTCCSWDLVEPKKQINILLKSSAWKHERGILEINKMSINMGLA